MVAVDMEDRPVAVLYVICSAASKHLEKILRNLETRYRDKIILMGDVNARHGKWDKSSNSK